MTLRELEAVFLKVIDERSHRHVEKLEDADGIFFLCPKCFVEHGSSRGVHGIICWFVGKVSDELNPKPGRWTPCGTGLDDLTFVPSLERSNSILLTNGCNWHGFVTNGRAE